MLHIQEAFPMDGYKMKIVFNTNEEGIADLSELVTQGVFKSIQDKKKFENFNIDDTVVWEQGELDIAPEFLYFEAFKEKPELQNLFKTWGYIQ